MNANIGSISSMWSRSRNAFAFRRRPYWCTLAAGATGGWVDLGVTTTGEECFYTRDTCTTSSPSHWIVWVNIQLPAQRIS